MELLKLETHAVTSQRRIVEINDGLTDRGFTASNIDRKTLTEPLRTD